MKNNMLTFCILIVTGIMIIISVCKFVCASNNTLEFNKLKAKWQSHLIFEKFDDKNPILVNYVEKLSSDAKYLYRMLNSDPKRRFWVPLNGNLRSADYNTYFDRWLRLALAYGTRGTLYYKNPEILAAIKDGLEFLVAKKGYNGKKYSGNWWFWQIGVPQTFVSIMMIIDSELTLEKKLQYVNVISGYVPNPFYQLYHQPDGNFVDLQFVSHAKTTGANRVNLALVVLGLGILREDEERVRQALNSIADIFKPTTYGDGFYKDGSFIQHHDIPYTGAYGTELVKKVSQILSIIKDSKYEVAPQFIKDFCETIFRAFLPLIYKGEMLSMVEGRMISSPRSQTGYGSRNMQYLLSAAETAPREFQSRLKEAVKYWMKENSNYYLSNAKDYHELSITLDLLHDHTVAGDTLPFIGTKMYASMDRFVQRTSMYMLGLSLYSSRISAFESGPGLNNQGWHTSDGMLYLYNDDEVQFRNSYWTTVDPYRFPGTTVDTALLEDETCYYDSSTSQEKWVGGVARIDQAIVGMALNKAQKTNNRKLLPTNLRAKKSWFVLNGIVVALGAGITGSTTASIETIVENRLLNQKYNYSIMSNHGRITSTVETSKKQWLLLKSDHQNVSIGYFFPTNATVDVVRETRTFNVSNIVYTGEYCKFIVNHGQNPTRATYAYVLLPGITEADIKTYSRNESVKIIENSADVQAVEMKKHNYLGINVWKYTGAKVSGISVDKPVSLMRQSKDGVQTYVLSDPTQSNTVITVKVPKDFTKIVTMSDGIIYNHKVNTFKVDFVNSAGNSKYITVK